MRTPAFISRQQHRLLQSTDVLVQTQPEKGKVTEKTDFLHIMCQGTWSRLNPRRKAVESLDSYFDRAEIEPRAHYFNTQGNQTDCHQSHFRKGGEIDAVAPGDILTQQQAFSPGQTPR